MAWFVIRYARVPFPRLRCPFSPIRVCVYQWVKHFPSLGRLVFADMVSSRLCFPLDFQSTDDFGEKPCHLSRRVRPEEMVAVGLQIPYH